jgi:hypothetical protein
MVVQDITIHELVYDNLGFDSNVVIPRSIDIKNKSLKQQLKFCCSKP